MVFAVVFAAVSRMWIFPKGQDWVFAGIVFSLWCLLNPEQRYRRSGPNDTADQTPVLALVDMVIWIYRKFFPFMLCVFPGSDGDPARIRMEWWNN